jgi:hypothetical protein
VFVVACLHGVSLQYRRMFEVRYTVTTSGGLRSTSTTARTSHVRPPCVSRDWNMCRP